MDPTLFLFAAAALITCALGNAATLPRPDLRLPGYKAADVRLGGALVLAGIGTQLDPELALRLLAIATGLLCSLISTEHLRFYAVRKMTRAPSSMPPPAPTAPAPPLAAFATLEPQLNQIGAELWHTLRAHLDDRTDLGITFDANGVRVATMAFSDPNDPIPTILGALEGSADDLGAVVHQLVAHASTTPSQE